jgi:hypothetical protein
MVVRPAFLLKKEDFTCLDGISSLSMQISYLDYLAAHCMLLQNSFIHFNTQARC